MSKDDFLKSMTGTVIMFLIPGTSSEIALKSLSAADRLKLSEWKKANAGSLSERIAALSVVGTDGSPMFNADDPTDLETLSRMDGAKLDAIVHRVAELNGLTGKAQSKTETPPS